MMVISASTLWLSFTTPQSEVIPRETCKIETPMNLNLWSCFQTLNQYFNCHICLSICSSMHFYVSNKTEHAVHSYVVGKG